MVGRGSEALDKIQTPSVKLAKERMESSHDDLLQACNNGFDMGFGEARAQEESTTNRVVGPVPWEMGSAGYKAMAHTMMDKLEDWGMSSSGRHNVD